MNAQNPAGRQPGTVLFLGTDQGLIDQLGPCLADYRLTLETFASPTALRRRAEGLVAGDDRPAPAAPWTLLALIDLRAVPGADSLGSLGVAAGPGQGPWLPLACLGPAGDLPQRLAALRAGAALWLPADLAPADIAARVAALAGSAGGVPERVLVVDDQPVSALFAARVLERAGMLTRQVADPLLVLPAMDEFAPDLVLMDLHMPGVSGIELTAVIREQGRFADLPIVFLSVELDPERQLEALRVGGDDFLAKPVPPGRLVTCVRTRLARLRMQRPAGVPGPLVAGEAPPGDRERLLARVDHLIRTAAGAPWALVYLEQSGDAAGLARLVAAVSARAGLDAYPARVGERGVGVLVRGDPERRFAAAIEALAQAVRADLGAAAGADGVPLFGVGWCPVPAGGGESVTLLSRAHKAARSSLGRQGRAEAYAAADAGTAPELVSAAIAAGRFQVLYQPMVPLSAAVAAERYELTLRLLGPQGELLAPAVFVPIARHAGQSIPLDRQTLVAGLDALRARCVARRPVQLFLHQSMVSAAEHGWVKGVRDEINARDLIQCRPVIQWQLADVERNLDLAARRAAQLDRLRIRLCLNGFTATERAEGILARLPVAYVRLERQLLRDLSAARLQALVDLAHDRKALVIATGIEGPEIITALYRAGVDLIQGPYVQPPAEAMEFDFADAVG